MPETILVLRHKYRPVRYLTTSRARLAGAVCREFTPNSVFVTVRGEDRTIPFDSVVLAAGGQPDRSLRESIEGLAPSVHLAGDCLEPRGIAEAMADGWRIGLLI